jgi:GT2 family glycosyltransferase
MFWQSNRKPDQEPPSPGFKPSRVVMIELSRPLPYLSAQPAEAGPLYRRALALVRLHGLPLGFIELEMAQDALDPAAYAPRLWASLSQEINSHLRYDGLAAVSTLTPAGLPLIQEPPCGPLYRTVPAQAPLVSVVIATHDRPDNLALTLDSLLAVDYPHYEIIVVDNAPTTAATANLIQQRYGLVPHLTYLREDCPGLAVAHNRGLLAVNGSIVAFTDDDVIVDRGWLSHIVKGFEAAETVGCVTGMICPAELDTPAQAWLEQFGGFSKGFKQQMFDLDRHRPNDSLFPFTVGRCGSGANMAFRTSALAEMGGFDPALGAGSKGVGGDDLAAFFEIISRGYTLVYEPGAIVYHHHRRDYAGLYRTAYGYGVSLTAYLTKTVVDRPGRLFELMWRMPAGLAYALSPISAKNAKKRADYPPALTNVERRGMLAGPVAYLRSHWHVRKMRHNLALFPVRPATPVKPTHLVDEVS